MIRLADDRSPRRTAVETQINCWFMELFHKILKTVVAGEASDVAMKTLVNLLVVLSCGLRPAFGATNDAHGTPGGLAIVLSGHKSAPQSPPGGVTTTIPENVLFQHAVKGMDTNSLNASSNGKLSAPGQQPAPTNNVPPVIRTTLGPVDVAAVTRINQRRECFSDQDKYGGILYKNVSSR